MFEWEISFALTPFMRKILKDKFVTVHLAAETIVPGGIVLSQVTHLYLKDDMFGRYRQSSVPIGIEQEKMGYYTYRFNGRNGAGNSEKLYIWSDGCVALRSIKLAVTQTTAQRTMTLVTHIDVQGVEEL